MGYVNSLEGTCSNFQISGIHGILSFGEPRFAVCHSDNVEGAKILVDAGAGGLAIPADGHKILQQFI